jgi:hypothetical protein
MESRAKIETETERQQIEESLSVLRKLYLLRFVWGCSNIWVVLCIEIHESG